jgi:hypothetical protein
MILGDMNARMPKLEEFATGLKEAIYTSNPDTRENTNGKDLSSLCRLCDLIPLNHLEFKDLKCEGCLTYKQGKLWVSQLDWALCSKSILPYIKRFSIIKDTTLPTDHAALSVNLSVCKPDVTNLWQRAKQLGLTKFDMEIPPKSLVCRSVPIFQIDNTRFCENLVDANTLLNYNEDVNSFCDNITKALYESVELAQVKNTEEPEQNRVPCTNSQTRWNNLLQSKNPRDIWQAINWSGTFDIAPDIQVTPTNQEFCDHYDLLLNSHEDNHDLSNFQPQSEIYIPILDDDISTREVTEQIDKLNAGKAAGCDGLAPGLMKFLPDTWIILLTFFFNIVFQSDYPDAWNNLKVFNIFKKGSRLDPNNYRGISIMSILPKIYDMILAARFNLWFKPHEAQAGGQKGRGCEEQILLVRLLIDIARKSKRQLYSFYRLPESLR